MSIEIDNLPGCHIRRLQQIAVAVFMEEKQGFGIAQMQYEALQTVGREPRIDQRMLARTIGFDMSTIGSVIDRRESRGLLLRKAHPEDRRVRLLTITPDGQQLLDEVEPSVMRAQERMLQPLAPEQRPMFMDMLRTLVRGSNALSRPPSLMDEERGQRPAR
jgi:DNA-binding MarR family transcriptional regulator